MSFEDTRSKLNGHACEGQCNCDIVQHAVCKVGASKREANSSFVTGCRIARSSSLGLSLERKPWPDAATLSTYFNNPSGRLINFCTMFGPRYGRIYCATDGTSNLAIHHYGSHTSVAGAEGARPTVFEAAEGRFHIAGW